MSKSVAVLERTILRRQLRGVALRLIASLALLVLLSETASASPQIYVASLPEGCSRDLLLIGAGSEGGWEEVEPFLALGGPGETAVGTQPKARDSRWFPAAAPTLCLCPHSNRHRHSRSSCKCRGFLFLYFF